MSDPRECCGSSAAQALRGLAAALEDDDLDRAISLGLLQFERPTPPGAACAQCDALAAQVIGARDERLRALAARDRYRARNERLDRRVQARAAKRAAAMPPTQAEPTRAALPAAAAAALARAKAKAARRT